MKRLLTLAVLAAAVLASSATPSFASAFGLFYTGRWNNGCNCCGLVVRPYNAFTPVCGGVGEITTSSFHTPCGMPNCLKKFFGCEDTSTYSTQTYFGSPAGGCCAVYGQPAPGVQFEQTPMPAQALVGTMPYATPAAGMMPNSGMVPVSYQQTYSGYPMGYAPTWGYYPMPAYYPAPVAPAYWYPMGR